MKVPKAKKMSSGNWFIYLRLGGRSISVVETTEKKAIHEAERIKAEYLATAHLPEHTKPKPTLSEAIDAYIKNRENVLSPSTIGGYRMIQRNYFTELLPVKVDRISKQDIQRSINTMSRTVSAKTIANAWGLVRSVLSDEAVEVPSVRLPQRVRKEKAFLQPEQIPIFCDAVKGTIIEIPALLALCSLRQSEIFGLRWMDIDIDSSLVHVNGAAVRDEHYKLVRKPETKNESSRRYVPMMPQLRDALSATKGIHSPEDAVVTITYSYLYKKINYICEDCGLPKVGVHGLRHSFASLMYHNGASEKVTMKLGGWSDNQTMRKIYTHIAEADERAAVGEFMAFFEQKNSNPE